MEKFRVGLVGCGGMGRSHLRAIQEHMPEFKIAALCDPFPAASEIIKEQFNLNIDFQNCQDMCEEVELDLVVVATQTRQHHKPTIAALERGIPVLCEKPIAIDPREADEMVNAAKSSGAKRPVGDSGASSGVGHDPSLKRSMSISPEFSSGQQPSLNSS